MSDIIIKDLCKNYGEKKVLDKFSCTIKKGEISCIQGASGKGKTTLLRIIAKLETADSGTIENLPESISFVFQEDRLLEDFNPISNISFAVGNKLSRDEICKHLEAVELSDSIEKAVKSFSGGMKRRLAIVRAICYDADFVIMDESFKGLDASLKNKVMSYVKDQTKGKTVLIVSHDEDEIIYMSGHVISLSK